MPVVLTLRRPKDHTTNQQRHNRKSPIGRVVALTHCARTKSSRAVDFRVVSMSPEFEEITVDKVEAAKLQLDAAIDAFFQGHFIVAITLAGAAEGILGEMLRRDRIQNSVEKIASLPLMLEFSNDREDRLSILNEAKNGLKHARNAAEDNLVISKLDPFMLIVRALGNSRLLNIEDTEAMKKFRDTYASRT